jgi:hypothetical protein
VPFALFDELLHPHSAAPQRFQNVRDVKRLAVLYLLRQRMSRPPGAARHLAPTRSGRGKRRGQVRRDNDCHILPAKGSIEQDKVTDRDEKVWIQYDGPSSPVADALLAAGIPREAIVLGCQSPELRQYTGFAVAQ